MEIETADAPMELATRLLVNSAGLGAQSVAGMIEGLPPETIPPLRYAKGNYFGLSGRAPFTHLVYPVPEVGGLGVHLTLDLAGQAKFGPERRMDRPARLHCGPGTRRALLRRDPQILAQPPGRLTFSRLCRHPPEAAGCRRTSGFLRPRSARSWRPRPDQPLWDRIAGPHGIDRAGRPNGANGRRLKIKFFKCLSIILNSYRNERPPRMRRSMRAERPIMMAQNKTGGPVARRFRFRDAELTRTCSSSPRG